MLPQVWVSHCLPQARWNSCLQKAPTGKDQPPKELQWASGTGVILKLGFNEQKGIWSSEGLVGRRMKLESPRDMEVCACPAQVSLLREFHG